MNKSTDDTNIDLIPSINIDDDFEDDDDEIDISSEITDIKSFQETYTELKKTKHKTLPILTKFEKSRLIGIRAQQLSNRAVPCVKGNFKSVIQVAEEELRQRKIPIIVRRILPNNQFEDWKIEDFENV